MLNMLQSLSNTQLGSLIFALGLVSSTILPALLRQRLKLHPGEALAKGADEALKIMLTLTLLLLAFCMVRTQGDHRSVEELVAREAAVILKLDRAYGGFGTEKGEKLQTQLLQYANTVVIKEWPLLPVGGESRDVTGMLAELSKGSKSLEPQTAPQQIARAEILSAFTQLMDLREARLAASNIKLPVYFWQAISVGILMLTVLMWFQVPTIKLVSYGAGVTCALSLLLTVLISTSGIFVGENRVTTLPIESVIAKMGNQKDIPQAVVSTAK